MRHLTGGNRSGIKLHRPGLRRLQIFDRSLQLGQCPFTFGAGFLDPLVHRLGQAVDLLAGFLLRCFPQPVGGIAHDLAHGLGQWRPSGRLLGLEFLPLTPAA